MPSADDIAFASIPTLAGWYRDGILTPEDAVRSMLERIERFDPALRAFIHVAGPAALRDASIAARELAAGHDRGPLHGIPYAVKDTMAVAGMPTTHGTRALPVAWPQRDATVVARLRDAGAVCLGKLNLHELGAGGTVVFPFGEPRNAWSLDHVAESSSSGSGSAVAAGFCTFSIGEDTGGSIRGPAAANGVVGLRPTFGRVSRYGVLCHGWNAATVGPLARSAAEVATVLQVVAGHDPADSLSARRPVLMPDLDRSQHLRGVRIGIIQALMAPDTLHADVVRALEGAVDTFVALGAEIVDVEVPGADHAVALQLITAGDGAPAAHPPGWWSSHYAQLDQATRTRMAASALVPTRVYLRAMRARAVVRARVLEALERVDVLLAPTAEGPARRVLAASPDGAAEDGNAVTIARAFPSRRASKLFSIANVPALAIPIAPASNGLPLSLQLAARPFAEATALRLAHVFQSVSGWHRRHPDIERVVAAHEGGVRA